MESSRQAKLLGIAALCVCSGSSLHAAAQPPRSSWLGPGQVDNPIKVVNVRKVARTLFGLGRPRDDETPLWIGPTRARVLWQKGWKWHESSLDTRLPLGLQGGPMVSFDLPLGGRLFSLEGRFSSLRYAFMSVATERPFCDELQDPQHKRMSMEGGLYLNVFLGGIRSPL